MTPLHMSAGGSASLLGGVGGDGPFLELREINKSFAASRVLTSIDLIFRHGEVHALAGQNGAGKSTLGKIIGGVHRPDSGTIEFGGRTTNGWSTRQALAHGVATIQQELSLVPDRSVAENVFLGIEERRFGLLRSNLHDRFDDLEDRCRLGLRPEATVGDLRLADQQKVEIMRALARNAQVIVMDEPTSSLTADEVDRLHAVIARLKADGRLVIYITHFLRAILSECDRVSVLRDGKLVKTAETRDETEGSLVRSMTGGALDIAVPRARAPAVSDAPPVLSLRRIRTDCAVRDVSLDVHAGEIVGLAGLVGSGRTEIVRAVYGADRLQAGEIEFGGESFVPRSVRDAIKHGVVLIPEDRKSQGLVLIHSVERNIGLPIVSKLRRGGLLSKSTERAIAREAIRRFAISPPDPSALTATLSGGNQQKTLFAKWMTTKPRLVLLDEPTRGVDVGARLNIYRLIVELASRGTAVLLISSELEEVLGLSHRVYLVRDGHTVGEVDPTRTPVEEVLRALFAVSDTQVQIGGKA